jgi:hypothetical protein
MKLPAETGQETKPGTLMNVRAKLVPAKENEEPETARRQDIRRKPEEDRNPGRSTGDGEGLIEKETGATPPFFPQKITIDRNMLISYIRLVIISK